MCRSVGDTARVLDALKNPERGYFDPRDVHSALPRALMAKEPYVRSLFDLRATAAGRPLAGVRVGIVREYMVKHVANDAAISDQIDREIKTVLRDKLGAELVESVDPLYPDDPTVANMGYTFQHALAEILPFHMPGYLSKDHESGRARVHRQGPRCYDPGLYGEGVTRQGAVARQLESASSRQLSAGSYVYASR